MVHSAANHIVCALMVSNPQNLADGGSNFNCYVIESVADATLVFAVVINCLARSMIWYFF